MVNEKLPSLQKQIILLLAQRGPLTKHETAKILNKAYKNVDFAFRSLKKKKLIRVVGKKEYRNRQFERYWLDCKGLLEAYRYGSSLSDLKKHVYSSGPPYIVTSEDEEAVELMFDFLKAVGRNKIKDMYPLIDFSGQFPRLKAISLDFVSGLEAKKLLKIFTKHPRYRKKVKEMLQSLLEEL